MAEETGLMPGRQPDQLFLDRLPGAEQVYKTGQTQDEIDTVWEGGVGPDEILRIPDETTHMGLPEQPVLFQLLRQRTGFIVKGDRGQIAVGRIKWY